MEPSTYVKSLASILRRHPIHDTSHCDPISRKYRTSKTALASRTKTIESPAGSESVSTLLTYHRLCKTYGVRPLFTDLDIHLGPADRIGIIGANGSGKSTLLRILAGYEDADSGERIQRKGLRIAFVEQEPVVEPSMTVAMTLAQALQHNSPDYQENEVEHQVRINVILGKLGFPNPAQPVEQLSGGWQKRLAIAKALVCEPELLLMDEPTNHLDLSSILWLEQYLCARTLAYAVVSHDRVFLDRVAGSIIELDPRHPGGLLAVQGGYRAFLEKRSLALAIRAQTEQSLANKVNREIEWLRRGPKARGTKAAGRIREAEALIADLDRMRSQKPGDPTAIELTATGRKSKQLVVLHGVDKTLGERQLLHGLDLLLRPGLRLGLVGENGSGKTTLLRIIAGEILPDAGVVQRIDGLSVVYFEQKREALQPEVSLRRTLAPEGDSVIYRGREIHVVSWARRFSFHAEQLSQPVGRLSGGERAKVAIAQLMLRPADVLLLDEPTNDLDIQTLEVLEESLLDFPGALVLVSHDRFLVDKVCNVLLGLTGRGAATILADVTQWEELLAKKAPPAVPKAKTDTRKPRKKSLSYLEKRELTGIEEAIRSAEADLQAAQQALADPAIASDAVKLLQHHQQIHQAQAEVERLYSRWVELDAKAR
jgi:ATP-binding cassette subfamily F protein uup